MLLKEKKKKKKNLCTTLPCGAPLKDKLQSRQTQRSDNFRNLTCQQGNFTI